MRATVHARRSRTRWHGRRRTTHLKQRSPPHRRLVGREPEPPQILEQSRLEFGPAPLPIVVLDAEQNAAVPRPGFPPDVDGVDDVSKVKVAGGGRRKPRYDWPHFNLRIWDLRI